MADKVNRAVEDAVKRYDRFASGESDEILAPWENPDIEAALASTGFGRRIFGRQDRQWDPEVPYPQIVPSQTTDPERPRTVAMGYDPSSEIVRVTFREGAVYEYYGVPPGVWEAFSETESPGRFIDDFLNGFPYERKPRLEVPT